MVEPPTNQPEIFIAKLLFIEKPVVDAGLLLTELTAFYPTAMSPEKDDPLLFAIPSLPIEFSNGSIPAQCCVIPPEAMSALSEEAFQQNWHWPEARAVVSHCRYELVINDLLTTALDYKIRHRLFMDFLVAVIRATQPAAVYSVAAQKLIQPARVIEKWTAQADGPTDTLINVRLFNVSNGEESAMVMDTLGLHTLGLPDWQIKFADYDATQVAALLWNYAYYIFEKGDVVGEGNSIQGIPEGSKWICRHDRSFVAPGRQVITIVPA